MLDLSLAGLIGAVAGTIVAALAYPAVVTPIERGMRARETARTHDEPSGLERELGIVRRVVLAADILLFAGIGYWLGEQIGG